MTKTPEELAAIRESYKGYSALPRKDIHALLAHIDEQAREIERLRGQYETLLSLIENKDWIISNYEDFLRDNGIKCLRCGDSGVRTMPNGSQRGCACKD